jgi:5-methyltetrahydrofolate--homocysteine methyltransferase
MKAAVAYLQPFMEKADGAAKGTIVLATVKGDVHDIGKNLVGIILSNNGYTVHDIGIKQSIENILAAYQQHKADAIGMSGLLVKSTVVMKEDLITLNERGLTPPVILGGAALTRRYVEHDLRSMYQGELFYGEDAFEGLRVMDRLCSEKRALPAGSAALAGLRRPRPAAAPKANGKSGHRPAAEPVCCPTHAAARQAVRRSSSLPPAPDLPKPPFLGSRVVTDIPVEEVFGFLNERTLISTQWQFRKNNVDPREYERQMREQAYPTLERLKAMCLAERLIRPAVVYGFFRCAGDGDDLVIYEDDGRTERLRYTFPRQDHGEYLCLSDYTRPAAGGTAVDHVGFMAVTVGPEVTRRCHELKEDRYEDYLYLHGLGVESAEALAEYWHRQLRREWGIAGDDATDDVRKLFKKHYRGCRYSFGYPACPDLEDQAKLFQLLDPGRIGLVLSEQFMLEPEQSTTAVVMHHPKARYFNVTRSSAYAAGE